MSAWQVSFFFFCFLTICAREGFKQRVNADALRSQIWNSWERELQAVVSCPTWALEPKSVQTLPEQHVPLSAEPPYQSKVPVILPTG